MFIRATPTLTSTTQPTHPLQFKSLVVPLTFRMGLKVKPQLHHFQPSSCPSHVTSTIAPTSLHDDLAKISVFDPICILHEPNELISAHS